MKILIVEDHQALREVMVEHLESQGHRVAGAAHADEMDTLLLQDKFDLLVLDLQLPGENGISIAQRLKRSQPGLYIIMMTARTSEADQVKGYMSGADVYLPKPTTPELLAAAIQSFSRRWMQPSAGSIHFDPVRLVLLRGDVQVELTKQEALILKALLEAPGQMLAHTRLLDVVNKNFSAQGKSNLEVHMTRLRKKLSEAGVASPAIKVVRNKGYQLVCEAIVMA